MALNVKAAMLVCVSFMTGLCWLMYQVDTPRVPTASPLLGAAEYAGRPVAGHPGLVAGEVEWREERARQFARANPLSRVESDEQAAALASAAPAVAPRGADRPALPPLNPPGRPTVDGAAFADAGAMPVPPSPAALARRQRAREQAVVLPVAATERTAEVVVSADAPAAASEAAPGAHAPQPQVAVEPKRYTVVAGDSVTRIARRHWSSGDPRYVRELLDANPRIAGRKNYFVLVGEEVLLPPIHGAVTASAAAPRIAERPPTADRPSERWYTIQPRDTLVGIAQRELDDATRWREIVELNEKLDPHKMLPGKRIKLPPTVRVAQR